MTLLAEGVGILAGETPPASGESVFMLCGERSS
jgi:hypothetical protein